MVIWVLNEKVQFRNIMESMAQKRVKSLILN